MMLPEGIKFLSLGDYIEWSTGEKGFIYSPEAKKGKFLDRFFVQDRKVLYQTKNGGKRTLSLPEGIDIVLVPYPMGWDWSVVPSDISGELKELTRKYEEAEDGIRAILR